MANITIQKMAVILNHIHYLYRSPGEILLLFRILLHLKATLLENNGPVKEMTSVNFLNAVFPKCECG